MKTKAECYMKDVLDEKTSIQMSYFAYFLTQTFEKMHLLYKSECTERRVQKNVEKLPFSFQF